MEFKDVVRRRRMVRSFTGDPVEPGALARIVAAGLRGPSAGFSQGAELVVVTDPAVRGRLAADGSERLRDAGLVNFVAQAPALIVVCTQEAAYKSRYAEADKTKARGDSPDEDFWLVPYWHTDAGAALMLILLAAVDERLGAGVAGVMGQEGQERLQRLLAIPPSYTAVAIVAIGHAAADAGSVSGSARTRARRPQSQVVHRDGW